MSFTIYLVGDSTVQSYNGTQYPQTGWGQKLWTYFKDADSCREYHPENTGFSQVMAYDLGDMIIDNRAMAGRSLRKFDDEGRREDVINQLKEGDFLFIQSAHNDANKEKEERYASPEDYKEILQKYHSDCIRNQVQMVMVTAIAMRDYDEQGNCKISFPQYRDVMIELGKEEHIPVLDLGLKTAEYCTKIGSEAAKKVFMNLEPGEYEGCPEGKEDNAHLQEHGAEIFAGILASLIQNSKEEELNPIKTLLKQEIRD